MDINLQETVKSVFNMSSFDYDNVICLDSLESVYDVVDLEVGEILSFEKFYQTFEKMVRNGGVYLELLPNDGVVVKMKDSRWLIYQELNKNGKIVKKGPIMMDFEEFNSFMNLFPDDIEGRYGVVFTYENGKYNASYCYMGPSNPSGHCSLAFFELGKTFGEKKLIELLDYSIVYEK